MSNLYFRHPDADFQDGVQLDLRVRLAMEFAGRIGIATAKLAGEDSSGRAQYTLLDPREVIDRAIAMADYLVQEGEKRGWIQPITISDEELAQRAGELEKIKTDAAFHNLGKR